MNQLLVFLIQKVKIKIFNNPLFEFINEDISFIDLYKENYEKKVRDKRK